MAVDTNSNLDEVVTKMNEYVKGLGLDLAFRRMSERLRKWYKLSATSGILENFRTGKLVPVFPYDVNAEKDFAELIHAADA